MGENEFLHEIGGGGINEFWEKYLCSKRTFRKLTPLITYQSSINLNFKISFSNYVVLQLDGEFEAGYVWQN